MAGARTRQPRSFRVLRACTCLWTSRHAGRGRAGGRALSARDRARSAIRPGLCRARRSQAQHDQQPGIENRRCVERSGAVAGHRRKTQRRHARAGSRQGLVRHRAQVIRRSRTAPARCHRAQSGRCGDQWPAGGRERWREASKQ